MQESQFYQQIIRETTLENTLVILEERFNPDVISALKPVLLKISDIQRLKKIHLAASTESLDTFIEKLYEE